MESGSSPQQCCHQQTAQRVAAEEGELLNCFRTFLSMMMQEPPRALIGSWLGSKDTTNFLHTHLPAPCKQKLKSKSGKCVLLENYININMPPTGEIFPRGAGSAVGAGANQSKKGTDTHGSASLPKDWPC